ncbi:uncharacterized protein ACA1_219840 [Acanthamoeba castellanii str. Neff]|uniref:Uncharacterized protein n=1 Tax=Acanthamoeba castellanii (strain ATCC 30010 / Neff) TaxID=1257118 RepID=L8GRI7_ACACF|nr:uncharacterized protein ACA1_219840 [Acanthamoeba castellanii str. Neff]ELR15258.1 hypothetical protein ACA1_219840 [Acanthamoeba castellanii str. Neff]
MPTGAVATLPRFLPSQEQALWYHPVVRTRKLGEHHQLCLSTITSDGIRTMEDVMAAMQKNRNTTGVVELEK